MGEVKPVAEMIPELAVILTELVNCNMEDVVEVG